MILFPHSMMILHQAYIYIVYDDSILSIVSLHSILFYNIVSYLVSLICAYHGHGVSRKKLTYVYNNLPKMISLEK